VERGFVCLPKTGDVDGDLLKTPPVQQPDINVEAAHGRGWRGREWRPSRSTHAGEMELLYERRIAEGTATGLKPRTAGAGRRGHHVAPPFRETCGGTARESFYCSFHGYNHSHSSKNCLQLQRSFADRYHSEFETYVQQREECARRKRSMQQYVGELRRLQQHPSGEGGGSWSQSRPSLGLGGSRGFSGPAA